jgi:hypothetical protein
MSQPFVFVNYANPLQSKDRAKRHIISRHIGRYYRNRSGPSRSKALLDAETPTPVEDSTSTPSNSPLRGQLVHIAPHRHGNGRGMRPNFWDQELIPRPTKLESQLGVPAHDAENLAALFDFYLAQQEDTKASAQDAEDRKPRQALGIPKILGQGRVDPFARFPIDENYQHVHFAVDYGMNTTLACGMISLNLCRSNGAILAGASPGATLEVICANR